MTKKLILSCNNNTKYVTLTLNNASCRLLLDTGASISVIKQAAVPRNVNIYGDNMLVHGIGGQISSIGHVYLTLYSQNGVPFQHKFQVFNNLPLKTDGIIGLDFLTKYKSNIDLCTDNLTLNLNEKICNIPLQDVTWYNKEYLIIPSRSESIHYIETDLHSGVDVVICTKELAENLFLAGSLATVKNGKIPIKILNVSEKEVKLPKFKPEIHLLNNYDVFEFGQTTSTAMRAGKVLQLLNLEHLNEEEKQSIETICKKYSDLFYLDGDKLTTTNIYEQTITLKPNSSPVYVKPYRLPQSLKLELNNQVKHLLENDIIEETKSEWSSPILLVPKKETGKWRLVIDYRKLNEIIQDDKFPLPSIVEILDSLSGSIYFSHLDLYSGYYQVSLEPSSRKYTSFCTSTGQFQMKRLPMGLKVSPSAFSRVMSVAMSGLNFEKCFIYLDDLIVFGRNLQTHNKNLVDVFERLRKVNLKLNPTKCEFLKKQLLYLGHVVSAEGVQPDPEKTSVLQNYPIPQNPDDVKRFVAFCNYYRKFIINFAQITLPLNNLCRKNEPFNWTEECQNSFDYLRTAMMNTPILQFPDFSKNNTFILQTDASGTAVGAVLCNGNKKPVAYASRPLNKSERNYPTIQKELVAIVWAVKYFRPYLYGRRFIIETDHKPLIYLFSIKDPSSRLLKFRLSLEEYDFEITYIKGKDNVGADALSRIRITVDELKNLTQEVAMVLTRAQTRKLEDKNKDSEIQIIPNKPIQPQNDQPDVVELLRKPNNSIELLMIEGKELDKLRQLKQLSNETECFSMQRKNNILNINLNYQSHFSRAEFVEKLREYCEKLKIKELCIVKNEMNKDFIKVLCDEINKDNEWNGPRLIVIRGVKRVVDEDVKCHILNDFHLLPTSAHAGTRRMINNIKRHFYWSGIDKDVLDYVKKCPKCQKMKHSRYTKQPMSITSTATYAFEKIFMDIVGPLPMDYDGNKYVLTIQCELSKFIEAYPLANKDTVSVAKALVNNFILRFGIPRIIASDRGKEFISTTMEEVCKLLEIEKLSSTAYHHQSIGSLENNHKHLKSFLRIQCSENQDTWSHWIPFWCFSYNSTVHTETKYQPFELVFGRVSSIPSRISSGYIEPIFNPNNYCNDIKYRLQVALGDARNNLLMSKEQRKYNYDKHVNPIKYQENDKILVKSEVGNKLEPIYKGPYVVIDDLGSNVKIVKDDKIDIIHKDRTKPYYNQ